MGKKKPAEITLDVEVQTTRRVGAKITAAMIRKAFGLPDGATVSVRVPGGGDWSNQVLDIDRDTTIAVSWEETWKPRKRRAAIVEQRDTDSDCPECGGQRVVDEDGACRACGSDDVVHFTPTDDMPIAEIDGEDIALNGDRPKRCPQCDTYTLDDEGFCTTCGRDTVDGNP